MDESSANLSLSPIYDRAPRGGLAYGKAPRNWGKNISRSMSFEGAMDGRAFKSIIENLLAPSLKRGQIIMDDLSVHNSRGVEGLIEQAGATLLFLPTGGVLEATAPADIRGFFAGCGYQLSLQLL